MYQIAMNACQNANFVPNIVFTSHRIDSILDMVTNQNCIALLMDAHLKLPENGPRQTGELIFFRQADNGRDPDNAQALRHSPGAPGSGRCSRWRSRPGCLSHQRDFQPYYFLDQNCL